MKSDVETRRQKVLELICEGMSGPEIALELKATASTIRNDVRVLIEENGADNKAQLAFLAGRRKLVT